MLPSGAREVGGRVLAPDLLRSPGQKVVHYAFRGLLRSKNFRAVPLILRDTHQHRQWQGQRRDQSHQQEVVHLLLPDQRGRTQCCGCQSAWERSRNLVPPKSGGCYSLDHGNCSKVVDRYYSKVVDSNYSKVVEFVTCWACM